MKELESRLADLESEVVNCRLKARRDRVVVGGLALIVTAFLIGGTGRPQNVVDELKTKKLIIEDDAGKARITLNADKDGPTLLFFDENGKIRIRLGTDKDGARLGLGDDKGKLRAGLGTDKDGSRMLLRDESGNFRVALTTDKYGPSLAMRDENGKDRAMLGTGQTKSPEGVVVTYPESTLLLFGPDGKILWQAPPK